jgi:hypothetical protein
LVLRSDFSEDGRFHLSRETRFRFHFTSIWKALALNLSNYEREIYQLHKTSIPSKATGSKATTRHSEPILELIYKSRLLEAL